MDTFENNEQIPQNLEQPAPFCAPAVPEVTPEAPVSQPEPPVQEETSYHNVGVGQQEYTGPAQQSYAPRYAQYQQPYYQQPGYYPPQQPQYQQYQQYQQPQYQPNPYRPGGYYAQPNPYGVRTPPQTQSPQPKKTKTRKKGGFWRSVLAAILILALVGGSCGVTAYWVDQKWQRQAQQMSEGFNNRLEDLQEQLDVYSNDFTGTSVSGTPNANADGLTPAQVYAQNVASVVAVSSTVTAEYFGQTTSGTATGSGFILTQDGYVVTNYHVVEGATAVTVTTNDGTVYTAAIVGGDSTNDVAVLKVEGTNLPTVTLGSSKALIVGDQVAAIGNPLGELTNTLTVGYISAKDRMITTEGFAINMLQTDASINSGNSGGPLFNMNGEVVGITSAKYSGASASGATIEGIGFAIPIDDVLTILEDLVTYGYVTGGYLGVSVSDMDAAAASYYGLPMGAYVQEVTPGFAAQKAGMQPKDIIVAVGDYQVNGVNALSRALRYYKPGETITVTVFRSGVELALTVTLDEKPAE